MADALVNIARSIAQSPAHDAALHVLSTVPGFPPIIQTVHILSVACIMASMVMLDLRMLHLAVPSQGIDEMVRRLLPWTWWALPLLAFSGGVLVAARPMRYFTNPVFGVKFLLLLPAVLLAAVVHLQSSRSPGFWESTSARRVTGRAIAAISLLLWIGVVLAGRWIAYADYLFPPEDG